jgi:type I restriction enzyme S subunit
VKTVTKSAHDANDDRQRASLAVQEAPRTYATWKRVRIGDALKLINGRAFKPSEWSQQGRPIVRIQNLNDPEAPFNYYDGELPTKFCLKKGDLLFAWSGTPGTSFGAHIWRGDDAWLNQHIFKVIFDDSQFDKRFLRYAINQNLNQYIAAAHGGAGLAHITKGRFEASTIICPLLDDQKRIVAEIEKQFSRLDEAVANFKRVRAHIRRYKAAVIEEAASGTTARDLPVIELLSDVFKTGISIKKSESEGVPSLKLSALRDGRIDFRQSKLLPVRIDEVRHILLRPGDFLVTRGNGSIKLVGAGALVEVVPGPVIYPDLLIRVRVRADTIEPRWLNLVWRTKYVRMQIERKAKTTAGIYKISQRDLGSINLPAPSLEEQKRITAEVERRLSVVEDLETQMSQESMRAARLRESVLAHAFSSNRSSSLGGQSEELRS